MDDKIKRAAAYIRVSTEDQLEYSPESQRKALIAYAAANGYILDDAYIFVDEGISGTSTARREGFKKMTATAKKKPKPFDAILLWKFSRFARNRQDSIVYKSMLRKDLGIDVISITEHTGDDKMSVIVEAIIEAMDEYYSINLAEEVRRGMTEKFSRGEAVTIPSFGYDIADGKYIINPVQAAVIKDIFTDFLSGVPIHRITAALNARGVRTNRGNLMLHRNIVYMLRNPVYAGKIRWAPKGRNRDDYYNELSAVIDGRHEAIIDLHTWDRAQQKLDENRRAHAKNSKGFARHDHMLRGLVRCSSCGAALVRTSRQLYMQCNVYAKGACTESHHVPIKKLENDVLAAIERYFKDLTFDLMPDAVPDARDDPALARLQLQLDRSKAAYIAGVDSLDEYKINKAQILADIEAHKKKVNTKPITKEEYAKKHVDVIAKLQDPDFSGDEKNRILRSFVRKIVYDKQADTLDIFFY
jgi:DNA invertase Pin-like site-specific DNA recombinase